MILVKFIAGLRSADSKLKLTKASRHSTDISLNAMKATLQTSD